MKMACVFPGQGSQSVGMLQGWMHLPAVESLLRDADDALGESISTLIRDGPPEALALTVNTQPAMLLAGVCAWEAWTRAGGASPKVLAGHSLGEYAALVAAGVIGLRDALRLVRLRAQAMQEAVPVGSGAMAAILGLDDEEVIAQCAATAHELGRVVEAVNFNAPSQVVIAGDRAAVQAACLALKARGAKRALPLPVSAPFHSRLLAPAGERLAEALGRLELRPPSIDVINNVDVRVEHNPQAIAAALVRQAYHPVRWVECIRAMVHSGVDTLIEMGPGKVLAGLASRIDRSLRVFTVYDPSTLEEALAGTSA